MLRLSRCWTFVILVGCSGGTVGPGVEYTLQLQPILPTNQDPFAELTSLEVEISPAVGEPTRVALPLPESGGTALAEDLPAFEDATFAVYGYDAQGLRAYGITAPMTVADGDELVVPVLFTEVDAVGWLTAGPQAVFGGDIVALGDGSFRVFGGLTNTDRGQMTARSDAILQLDLAAPSGLPGFTQVGTLPTWAEAGGDTHTERVGFRMHRLTAGAHAGKYLLAGGSYRGQCSTASQVTDTAFYYDPSTGLFIPTEGPMDNGREQYASAVDARGHVVYQGGAVYNASGGCYIFPGFERYNAETDRFEGLAGGTEAADVGGFGVAVGTDGTLFCGGGDYSGGEGWVSSAACHLVSLEGEITEADPLPVAVSGAAAVTLDDGSVLVTGGIHATQPVGGGTADDPAEDGAWLWRSGQWTTLPAGLNIGRAGHRMALLPDGRVLVVGGTTTWGPFQTSDDALACAELFDPAGPSFTPLSDCEAGDPAGDLEDRTQEPLVAVDPDFGVLIVGGANSASAATDRVGLFVPSPE